MGSNKRIAIARAIMYKELAKRNVEREHECKRRGLWALWSVQTEYKTLWHFLRASKTRLIEVCYNTIDDLNQRIDNLVRKRVEISRVYQKYPGVGIGSQLDLVMSRIEHYNHLISEIDELVNKLNGGNYNENQN